MNCKIYLIYLLIQFLRVLTQCGLGSVGERGIAPKYPRVNGGGVSFVRFVSLGSLMSLVNPPSLTSLNSLTSRNSLNSLNSLTSLKNKAIVRYGNKKKRRKLDAFFSIELSPLFGFRISVLQINNYRIVVRHMCSIVVVSMNLVREYLQLAILITTCEDMVETSVGFL